MGLGDCQRHHRAEDLAGRAARGTAGRSAPGPSSRSGCTSRSGCSARSASAPRCCSPARSGTTWPCVAPGSPRLSHRAPERRPPGRGRARHQAQQPPKVVRSASSAPRASSSTAPSSHGGPGDKPADPFRRDGGDAAAAARHRPPRPRRAADAQDVREPVVLHRGARPDRDRREGNSVLPAHLGRLRAPHRQAHRARRPRASAGSACAPPARTPWSGGSRRSRRPASASAGRTATPASGRPTCSATRTGTRWSCTGRPSGTRRADELEAVAEEPGAGLPGPRRQRPAPRPRQLPGARTCRRAGTSSRDVLGGAGHRADPARRRHDLRAVAALHQQVLRRRLHRGLDRHPRAAAPRRVRAPTPARTSCAPRTSAWTTGVFIETGPHKHAIQQTFFLYVYEPGGNRIELCNAGRPAGARAGLAARSPGPRPNGPRARPGA